MWRSYIKILLYNGNVSDRNDSNIKIIMFMRHYPSLLYVIADKSV